MRGVGDSVDDEDVGVAGFGVDGGGEGGEGGGGDDGDGEGEGWVIGEVVVKGEGFIGVFGDDDPAALSSVFGGIPGVEVAGLAGRFLRDDEDGVGAGGVELGGDGEGGLVADEVGGGAAVAFFVGDD